MLCCHAKLGRKFLSQELTNNAVYKLQELHKALLELADFRHGVLAGAELATK